MDDVNRTDRLYAIREELRRAGRAGTTGARLARLFEVSERTIKRDVSALQQAGAPIWAQSGPGGGYVLDASASLPPVNFTPTQAVAMAVALATLPSGSPFAVDAAAARGKLWDTLGERDRQRAQRLSARVWTRPTPPRTSRGPLPDGVASGPAGQAPDGLAPVAADAPAPAPAVLRAVEQALGDERALVIAYAGRDGAVTQRTVEPILLAHTGGRWYLVAWCQLRVAIRWFRLDRIADAHLTAERYVPRDVASVGEPPAGSAPVA
ncbi:helix-turn-helix transcriptional regulator [Actinotalea fermentans]|nr:YafY family protein [Actinotalea fermentans]